MTDCKLIIAGLGGQGVVFLSRLIAQAALIAGDDFITYESHGMAMRGGSVSSQVKIGKHYSPLIGHNTADILLVLAPGEYARNRHFLKPGGTALVNSDILLENLAPENIVDATTLAVNQNLPKAVNLVFSGWASEHPAFPFNFSQMQQAAEMMAATPAIKTANLKALEVGRSKILQIR
ncbi:2-oxoacid:acceptor oxidoreductase family protein [bacterium]|nr:2-oxoacid:acceptor oxidoreductase family protein [bacterium]